MSDLQKIMEKFKCFMENKNCVGIRHRIFHVIWIEKFFMYLEDNKINDKFESSDISGFLSQLARDRRYKTWQVQQAAHALGLFLKMMKNDNENKPEKQIQKQNPKLK